MWYNFFIIGFKGANIMQAVNRYDIVGSFLRPEYLKKARAQFKNSEISATELKIVEDKAITDLVSKQKRVGLKFFTDGEFRRETWHLDFMWGFKGVGHVPTKTGIPFHDEPAMIDDTYLTGKISVNNHPFVEHYKFLKQFETEDFIAKQTLPAPAQFLLQMTLPYSLENTLKFYNDIDEFIIDLAKGYKKVISKLYAEGCRHIQFDDCTWGTFVSPSAKLLFETDDKGLENIMELYLKANNLAIEGKPDDLIINTHVCRGNFHSTYCSSGAYDKVEKYLFARENVDAFFLEFDDERSGGFEPLKNVANGKQVVLGLITTKRPLLEDKQAIINRIKEATKYIPLERLALSPQCGFASCEIGNKLTQAQQWDKIALAKQIAEEIWKD